MMNLLLIWMALFIGLIMFAIDKPPRMGALTLAYFLSWSVIHVPGALVYLHPDFPWNAEATKVGFEVTLYGMAAFVVGAIAARMVARMHVSAPTRQTEVTKGDILNLLGWRVLIAG